MLKYSAYLDESIGPTSMSVAGVVARADKWSRFRESWGARLDREGLQVLGSSDLVSGLAEPFRGWSREKRTAVLKECLHDITDSLVAYVHCAVIFEDFYAALEDVGMEIKEQKHRDQNCYALCGIGCLGVMAHWAASPGRPETSVATTFESGMKGIGKIERYWTHLQGQEIEKDSLSIDLVSPSANKRAVVELQAADFYARENMLHVARTDADGNRPPPRGLHYDLVRPFQGRSDCVLGGYWDRKHVAEELRKMIRHDGDSRFNRELLLGWEPESLRAKEGE